MSRKRLIVMKLSRFVGVSEALAEREPPAEILSGAEGPLSLRVNEWRSQVGNGGRYRIRT